MMDDIAPLELTEAMIVPAASEEQWNGASRLLGHARGCRCSTCTLVIQLSAAIQVYDRGGKRTATPIGGK